MKIYKLSSNEVFKELKTSKKGLSTDDSQKRLEEYGPNQIEEVKRKPSIISF
jgi:magnesium-transporting ATPase (P-type)